MNRREFAQLAALGAASAWLPACSVRAEEPPGSGARATRMPAAGVSTPAESALSTGAAARAFAPDGSSFELAPQHNYIDAFGPSGNRVARIGDASRAPTTGEGDVSCPIAAAWDDSAKRLLVLERGNARIQAFDAQGKSLGVLAAGLPSAADLVLAASADGEIYVAASSTHHIQVLASNGRILGSIGRFGTDGAGLNGPTSVALAPDGTLHVVDSGSARVKVFDTRGSFVGSYGAERGDDRSAPPLVGPRAVRFDAAGHAWVADTFGAALHVYDAQGRFQSRVSPRLADGSLAAPVSLSQRADGSMYAALIAAA